MGGAISGRLGGGHDTWSMYMLGGVRTIGRQVVRLYLCGCVGGGVKVVGLVLVTKAIGLFLREGNRFSFGLAMGWTVCDCIATTIVVNFSLIIDKITDFSKHIIIK